MEVVVLGTEGIPASSILSIRSGSTRRQAPLANVDKPFRFPCKPEDCTTVKVDVFRYVGTARTVSQAGTSEHKLILESVDNQGVAESPTGMEISFQMRPATKDAQCIPSGKIDSARRNDLSADSDRYLERHNVTAFLQGLLQGLIKEQPKDPYDFIVKQFVYEAAQIQAQRERAKRQEAMKDPMEDLRKQVLGCLQEGIETGSLEQALEERPQDLFDKLDSNNDGAVTRQELQAGAQAFPDDVQRSKQLLDEANREVQELHKLVESLQTQLSTLLRENGELKETIDEAQPRDVFVEGLKAPQPESELDALRHKARDTLNGACKEGQLAGTLRWLRSQEAEESKGKADPEVEVMNLPVDGATSGEPEKAITPIAFDIQGGFEGYYGANIGPTMSTAAWAGIHGQFPGLQLEALPEQAAAAPAAPAAAPVVPFQEYYHKFFGTMPSAALACVHAKFPHLEPPTPPAPKQVVDLSHVEALHAELEQLAKDRASLLAQVNKIRDRMEEVNEENKTLAAEVMSRPRSPPAQDKASARARGLF